MEITVVKKKRYEGRKFLRKKVRGRVFNGVIFDKTVFRYVNFTDCRFTHCEFKDAYLGFHVKYKRCVWTNCNFYGKYLNFGRDSFFSDCEFNNVFIQSGTLEGATFRDCRYTGKLRNLLVYGNGLSPAKPTVFQGCDFSEAGFENVVFYAGVDFSKVILPKKGIRVFRNPEGAFSELLRNKTNDMNKTAAIPLDILGREEMQDPIVLDCGLFQSLFTLDQSRKDFEEVSNRFEVPQRFLEEGRPYATYTKRCEEKTCYVERSDPEERNAQESSDELPHDSSSL